MVINKAYLKSTGRLFLKHIIRLLSISAIFVVTVSLDSGFGDVQGDIKQSINASYRENNIHDFTVSADFTKHLSPKTDIETIYKEITDHNDIYDVNQAQKLYYFDMINEKGDYAYRTVFKDNYGDGSIDKLDVLEGRLPTNQVDEKGHYEVVIERKTKEINLEGHKIGDTFPVTTTCWWNPEFNKITFNVKVVGIVQNPRLVAVRKETSSIININSKNEEDPFLHLENVFYFDSKILDDVQYGDLKNYPTIAFTMKNRSLFDSYSKEYVNKLDDIYQKLSDYVKDKIKYPFYVDIAPLTDPLVNFGFYSLNMYAEKVGAIAAIFIVFFMLIAILVIYSTMSRLLDEERSSMAVLKTNGYSNFTIGIRYVFFALIGGLIGVAISILPARFVTQVILNAFTIQYTMKPINFPLFGSFFFLLSGGILLISLILVLIKSIKMSSEKPIELLTHKAPKLGKKIFLEKIPSIWNRLSFKFKSTWRNVFLFKSRFIMTVLSVAASTVLLFASFCLLDCTIANIDKDINSLFTISFVLVIFSGALCALVIYNITNINISERTREIATLMVSGYRDKELTGYIFREIYILVIIGAILGIPAGYGFMYFVFNFINAKAILSYEFVHFYPYLLAPIATILFAFIATLLLRKKILKTDMNESLKVLE